MKRVFIVLAVVVLAGIESASAWGRLGHEVIIEVAKRHLTENTKKNIAKYISYDITKDAVYMDIHRDDKEIAYTTAWHVYNTDEKHDYDMNPRLSKGDAILAMKIVEHNLTKQERLTDSAMVMNIRCLLHFAGDMHCPTHSYIPGPRCFWPCELNGVEYKEFHKVYDIMPALLHPNMTNVEIAALLDNASKKEIKRIQKGNLHEWVHDIGSKNYIIYEWNPHNTPVLNPKTVELSRELIDIQLRNAGYRLAFLLNKYFGK